MNQPSRRRFLSGAAATAAGALGLVACGDDSSSPAGGNNSNGSTTSQTGQLIANFPQEGFVVAGQASRLPFLITGPLGAPLDRLSGPVTFRILRDGQLIGDPIEVAPHDRGIPKAFLPLRTTFDLPGYHDVSATYEGTQLEAVTIGVAAASDVVIPQIGGSLPSIATPTTANSAGVSPICTRVPACPFHEADLAASLTARVPMMVLLSTPLFCSSAICGPVLELVLAAGAQHPEVRVIHVEPYANPNDVSSIGLATPSPFVTATKFSYEPTLIVVDRDGRILDRLDTIFDADELDSAFASLA